jgi:hypothetical protein
MLSLAVLVLTQRFALHLGRFQLSFSFIAAFGMIIGSRRWGYGVFKPGRWMVWLCVLILAVASTVGARLDGTRASIASAAAFLACGIVLVVGPSADDELRRACRDGLLEGFRRIGMVVAVFVAFQWFVQSTTGHYLDPLSSLPHRFLMSGYNTQALVEYGLKLKRPNGFIFLEPSLASQFLGLAGVATYVNATLSRRARGAALGVIIGALCLTLSGTGIAVFGVGWLLAARPARALKSAAALLVALALVGAFVGFDRVGGGIVSKRLAEVTRPDGSGNTRFIWPYQTVAQEDLKTVGDFVVGNGPGAADVRSTLEFEQTGKNALFNTALKLFWEYGAGAALLVLSLLVQIVRGIERRYRPVGWAMLLQYAVLTGSLVFPFAPAMLVLISLAFSEPAPATSETFADHARRREALAIGVRGAPAANWGGA